MNHCGSNEKSNYICYEHQIHKTASDDITINKNELFLCSSACDCRIFNLHRYFCFSHLQGYQYCAMTSEPNQGSLTSIITELWVINFLNSSNIFVTLNPKYKIFLPLAVAKIFMCYRHFKSEIQLQQFTLI
jgi:hypothetical protein